jgi:hypothetical protein
MLEIKGPWYTYRRAVLPGEMVAIDDADPDVPLPEWGWKEIPATFYDLQMLAKYGNDPQEYMVSRHG